VRESGNTPPDSAPDTAYRRVNEDTNSILTGGWIFAVGCLAFLVFAVVLRERLAAAEGGTGCSRTSPSSARSPPARSGSYCPAPRSRLRSRGRHRRLDGGGALEPGDSFFVAAELSAILLMLGTGMVVLRSALMPKWWAWFGFVLAVVLAIGPIGWAG
jgi:hypothetical protein